MHSQQTRAPWLVVCVALLVGWLMAPPARAELRPADQAPALRAVVTVPPLKGLIEPLLPPGSEVVMLMRPGKSEHGYEFTPQDIAQLAKADVVALVGLGLETRVEDALARQENPSRRVVVFGEVLGLRQDPNALHNVEPGHVHGPDCNHGPGWIDQHLWLDPVLVERLLPALRDAVRESLVIKAAWNPTQEQALEDRLAALLARVRSVDEAWRTGLEPLRGAAIVTHHDAFGRPAERYGLAVAAVIRPGQAGESTPRDIANATNAIRERGARAVFFEPQFDPRSAERIARQAGVRLGKLDPLGSGDWFAMMDFNLRSLVENLTPPSTGKAQGQAQR